MSKWTKYRKRYHVEWENEPIIKEWIAPVPGDIHKAFCVVCQCELRAHHNDLLRHAGTQKHMNHMQNPVKFCSAETLCENQDEESENISYEGDRFKTITVTMEMNNVVSNTTVYRNRQKSTQIMIELQKQREQGTFCDVLLEAGGLQYWAHSCVLAAHSKKLGSAVENGKAKFGAKGVIKMKLPTSNSLLVEALIKYMYDSHLSITSENVEDLVQLATKLEMEDIKQCCSIHLCRTMSTNNWATVKKIGEAYKLEEATKAMQDFCAKNFCEIVHDFEFLNIDVNLLEMIIRGSNEGNISRIELHCLYGILKWTCHDLDARKDHYKFLMTLLNPIYLSKEKCLALFEEETIKASNLLNDLVTTNLMDDITRRFEMKEMARQNTDQPADLAEVEMEDGELEDDDPGDSYEPGFKKKKISKDRLIRENEYLRTVDRSFICPMCCKTFERMNSLVGHFRVHNAHWQCEVDGFSTNTYYQRVSHQSEKHGGMLKNSKYMCEQPGCEYETDAHFEMRKHFEDHGKAARIGGPFRCDVCRDVFNTRLELHNHRSASHKDVAKKCHNCSFETFTQTSFEAHLKSNHPDVAVIFGYMTKEEAKTRAVSDAMKSSDIYSKKTSVRGVKECPFCKGYCTMKNENFIKHIKNSHPDVTVEQIENELKKILSKSGS